MLEKVRRWELTEEESDLLKRASESPACRALASVLERRANTLVTALARCDVFEADTVVPLLLEQRFLQDVRILMPNINPNERGV